MKKILILFCIAINLLACSNQKKTGEYSVIDVLSNIEKYKQVYCSDYFSSMELIPLETSEDCLVSVKSWISENMVLFNNDIIFIQGENNFYTFDITGKFLNSIGQMGQGPGEYLSLTSNNYFNMDDSTIFVDDGGTQRILEYDYNGKYIQTIPKPIIVEGFPLSPTFYIGGDLFIGHIFNPSGKKINNYCLFDRNGDVIKYFPNHFFFDRASFFYTKFDGAFLPKLVDDRIYLKDYCNDTIYTFTDSLLKPTFILKFGKYAISKEDMGNPEFLNMRSKKITLKYILGTSNYFFYSILVPDIFSRPKAKQVFIPLINKFLPDDNELYGIYDITTNTNILLDTDAHGQKGIINDINGGFPFFPRYYAGDGVVVDIWQASDMKEILTEAYFSTIKIKDQQAHQKLRELLKTLDEEDNPVVVIAKLK